VVDVVRRGGYTGSGVIGRAFAEEATRARGVFGGNGGSGKGLVDVKTIRDGCVVFAANPQKPPAEDEMPFALSQALQEWMLSAPVRVRGTARH
jgi:hypothetical protein